MAQTLEDFEQLVEHPLTELHAALSNGATARHLSGVLGDAASFKRTFRKKLQVFAADLTTAIPPEIEINGFEPIARR